MPCLTAVRRRAQRCRCNVAARVSLFALVTLTFAVALRVGSNSSLLAESTTSFSNGSAAAPPLEAWNSDGAARGDTPASHDAGVGGAAALAAAAAAGVPQRWFPDFARSAGVSCARILAGSRSDTSKAAQFVRKHRRKFVCTAGDRALADVACDELTAAGYASAPSTAEGAAFPLAFGLRMHTCAVQAELLLRSVYEPQNVYCVHVDANAGADVIAAMRRLAVCLPNVYVAPPDDDFVYASVSQLRADLTCMRLLLAAPAPWRYFLNLAGQELPLRTNLELVRLLRGYNGSNEIKSRLQPLYRYRYRYRFWCTDAYTNRTRPCDLPRPIKGPPPGRVTVYKGLAYGFFSRAFVAYAVAPRGRAAALYEWFKDTFAPEEHFFATLVRLSDAPGGYDGDYVDDGGGGEPPTQQRLPTSRAVAWLGGRKRCSGRYVRQVCVYGVGDTPWLLQQQQAIANKFRYDFDPLALQCMAEHVINRTLSDRAAERASSRAAALAATAPESSADAADDAAALAAPAPESSVDAAADAAADPADETFVQLAASNGSSAASNVS